MRKLIGLGAIAALIVVLVAFSPSTAQTTNPSTVEVVFYEGKLQRHSAYLTHVPEINDQVTLITVLGTRTYTVTGRRFKITASAEAVRVFVTPLVAVPPPTTP